MTTAVFATRQIRRTSMPRWKRTLDIALCLVALPVLIPVAVLVAILHKKYSKKQAKNKQQTDEN